MASSYWDRIRTKRLNRRRLLYSSAAGAGGAVLLAACGGEDEPSGGAATGGTGGTGTAAGTGGAASGATGVPSSSTGFEPGSVVYRKDFWKLPDETANAVPGGVFPGRADQEVQGTLDPGRESSFERGIFANAGSVSSQPAIYEHLLRLNIGPGVEYGSPEYGAPAPLLAEDWEISDGGTTYTFRMRQGVKFQNIPPVAGRVMDIEDVRMSIEHFREASNVQGFLNDVLVDVQYPDARTVVFKTKEPYGYFLERAGQGLDTFFVQPKELASNPDLAATTAIGTGPGILDEWERDIAHRYRRNDDYWQGQPLIERWNMPIIPEAATRRAQFITQHIFDYEYRFDLDQRDALKLHSDAPDAVMVASPPNDTGMIMIRWGKNLAADDPARDPRYRIALRMGVDYESITNFLYSKDEFAAQGIEIETSVATHAPANPTFWLDPRKGELGEFSKNYLLNVEEARKLFEAAGHTQGVTVNFVASDRSSEDTQALYRRAFLDSGLFSSVEFTIMPWVDYFNNVLLKRDYSGQSAPGHSPANADYLYSRTMHAGYGLAYWEDAKMDGLVEKVREALDIQARIAALKEYQIYAAETMYQLTGHGYGTSWALQWPWLHNQYHQPHARWLAEDMPRRNG